MEPRPKLAMEKITAELNPALDGALDDLKGSKLASAAGNERAPAMPCWISHAFSLPNAIKRK